MEGTNVYYVVKKGALPEVLLKVVEANRLIDTQKAASVQEAVDIRADGQTDAVRLRTVFPAVEHEIAVGRAASLAVETAEDMIELQRGRKLHKRPPLNSC